MLRRLSKALTARKLLEMCGGRYAGLSLLVDQLSEPLCKELEPVMSIALAEEVGAP